MTTVGQLRKAALGLPGVEEVDGAFTVEGATFAVGLPGGAVELALTGTDAERVLTEHPTAERVVGRPRVQVPLADLDGQQLNHWVRRAWFGRAPRELIEAISAADTVEPGAVGDLPASIGRPATRGLAGAGIVSLADVAARSDAELLAIHGVGPKAVRLLREATG
ncbi:hypothetical protein GCM10023216_28620 [Isoptericola chiayiensis]|uniref:Helix-hairpin-helix domain-containing protein n=1 Tax=Isoptericola chiayiensis TaxID=579446 RepID=A0ABP8YM93_9MICO|nr:hypothetical protein [Isoptericola chiayiensis]NOW02218.1 hypothetical protein [Isoptericola chiayiensis]